jgi:phytoene desaturase
MNNKTNKICAVIGSGFGGLAAAIRMQSAGVQTILFEQRDKPGGRAYVYERDGFTFDAGPTVITDPTCLAELFALSGRRMEDYVTLLPVNPFYRLYWEDGRSFDYVNDSAGLDREIAKFNPTDVEGYRRFYEYSKAVFVEGYQKLGTVAFPDFRSMLRCAPQLMKLESYRSVYGMVSRFIKDPQLRQAFSFHSLLVGGNPFATSAIYTLIHALERQWGVWFPKGGTGALIRAMVKLFTDLGGVIKLSTPVAHIETGAAGVSAVIDDKGVRHAVDFVISNADVVHTYEKLLGDNAQAVAKTKSLKAKSFSMSLFVIYFGLKTQHQIPHHCVLFGPRYRELLHDIFSAATLPDDFSLYLHAPTVTDPALAPPGCSSYYVLSPVPHLGHAPLDWAVEGPRYRDRILDYLEARILPNLRRDLVTVQHFTPQDFKTELNAHVGSAFSVEPVLWQSAYFRPHNRDKALPGLYIVGAGTHPGAGIPGVVGSAKATAGLVFADYGITQPALPTGSDVSRAA